MKTSNIIRSTLLSLLLVVSLLCAGTLFALTHTFQNDHLRTVLSAIHAGEKIMGYEYLPEDGESADIYDRLAEVIEPQVVLAVNVSGDKAAVCQKGAFAYVKELHDEDYAYTTLDPFAEDLGKGYTQTAVAEKIISPNRTVTYKNVKNERVWTRMEPLLQESVTVKYKAVLESLMEEGFFCALDIDQKETFAWLLRTGKDAARIQNGLYRLIEERIGAIFDEHFLNYLDCLKDEKAVYSQISQQSLNETFLSEVNAYVHGLGIAADKLDTAKADQTIIQGISNHIAPRLSACLPSYQDTVAAIPKKILPLLKMGLNGTLAYAGFALAGFLGVTLLLIGKTKALPFFGSSLLLSGMIAFFSKSFSPKAAAALADIMTSQGNSLSFLVPDLTEAFFGRFSSLGIYPLIVGIVLLALSLLFQTKKKDLLN